MKLNLIGSIGVGKSTTAKRISEIENIEYIVEDYKGNPFWSEFYETIDVVPNPVLMNLQMDFLYKYKQQSLYCRLKNDYVSDFSCLTGLAFVYTQIKLNQMSPLVGNLYIKLWKQDFLELDLIDRDCKNVIMDREPCDLLEMINKRGRTEESGIDYSFISVLRECYLSLPELLKPYGVCIDVVKLKKNESVDSVVERIMEKI